MGDAVLMTPALAALRSALPDAELSVVLGEELADLLEGHQHVDRVLPLGRRGLDKLSLARRLRRIGFDAVINFHGGPTSAGLTAASGAPLRVGRDTYRFRFLYNLRVSRPEEVFADPAAAHTVHTQASLVKALGVPVPNLSPSLRVPGTARARLTRRLEELGVPPKDYVVIQPTASFPSKQWPAERFGRLGRSLKERTGRRVLVSLPGFDARNVGDFFSREFPVVSDLPSGELMALLETASLYVGNDSGPMHVAAALGTPVVGIFGSSDPQRWHPWGVPHRTLWAGLDCSPCHGKWCVNASQFACLTELPVETVLDAVLELLSSVTAEAREG
jgi:heptosyltransferase-3